MSENSFKQIILDEITGKLKIIDNENKTYNCNIYGEKSPEYLPNLTGFSSFTQRKKMNIVNDIKIDCDKSLYRPQNTKFEGYCQFPRPLSQPFFNEKVNKDVKQNMISTLLSTNKLKLEKNKNLVKIKPNEGLSYYSSSVGFYDHTSKNILISRITEYIEKRKEENKNTISQFHIDPKIRALKKMKKILNENSENKLVNGRELMLPDKSFEKKFLTTFNLLRNRKENLKNIKSYGKLQVDEVAKNNFCSDNFKTTSLIRKASKYDFSYCKLLTNINSIVSDLNELNSTDNLRIKKKSNLDLQLKKEKELLLGFNVIAIR